MLEIVTCKFVEKIQQIHARTAYVDRPEAEVVRTILRDIREKQDQGILDYVKKFEWPASSIADLIISIDQCQKATASLAKEDVALIKQAIQNIRGYHEKFLLHSWQDPIFSKSKVGMKVTPLERVGVYVPGGTAAYPTSVLMNVIPAQVAGVKEIVMVSPADRNGRLNPYVLAAADLLGVTEMYAMGGAQAVGALAYGTPTVRKVDKIVGPGNIYVTLAKKEVFGVVGIDKLAGPSDVCVVADDSANEAFIAADLLAQAEHDALASAICITDSEIFADKINVEVTRQFKASNRQDILRQALLENSAIFVVPALDQALMVELVDLIAPEHLEIFHRQEVKLAEQIQHAGATFVGKYSAEVLGDYMLGPNHVLPTGGNARFSSPLSAVEFQKYTTMVQMSEKDYASIGLQTAQFADLEGLPAHAQAARIRLKS